MFQRMFLMIVLASVIIAPAARAQIQVTAAAMDGPGVYMVEVSSENGTVATGSAGANQSWNIPAAAWVDTAYSDIVAPASTPFAAIFPTASRAQHSSAPSEEGEVHFYQFEGVLDDGWYFLGIGYQLDTLTLSLPMNPPLRQAPLPLTYGATWTNVITTDQGEGVIEVDSSLLTVDGWGTLTTPFGTYNVLRIYSEVYEITHTPGGTTISEDASLTWIDEHGLVVADMESAEETHNPNFTQGSVSMRYRTTSAVEPMAHGPVAQSFVVGQNYPNPFNPTTVLPVEIARQGRVTLDIYNEMGQLVAHEVQELTAGAHNLPVNGAAWSTGTYFARVSAQGQSSTTKMHLLK